LCRIDPNQVSTIEPHDDKGVKQCEADGRDHNRVHAATSGAWLRKKVRHP
jgi:hypothetical protein